MCGLRAARHRSRSIPLRLTSVMRACWTFRPERFFPLSGPQLPRPFAVFALELVRHPEQRAVDDGAIIASEFDNACLDDEAAEFNQVPCALAALDLPGAHVMTRLRCLMPVARRPVAVERRQRRGQVPMQFAVSGFERTRPRASPMPPFFRRPWFRPARSARPPVPLR